MNLTVEIHEDNFLTIQEKSQIIADARYEEMKKRGHNTSIFSNRDQWLTGHLAEYAVSQALRYYGYECSDPDLKLRTGKKRRFDPDLISEIGSIAVKCDHSVPYSWNFQEKDSKSAKYLTLVHRKALNEFTVLGIYDYSIMSKYAGETFKSFTPRKLALYWKDTFVKRTGSMYQGIENVKSVLV